ncbi:MAG TPA: pantetheine-phosphate adenylyltransferase [Acidimicrobiales bacterium]|nr:pantetheine-phosphate adenylyltransferase [Acidimicrobiales bacterium]
MITALFPGSFDPLHNGHFEMVEIASRLFDRVVIGAIRNPGKDPLFTLEERQDMIEECVAPLGNVAVTAPVKSLTVDVAREVGADVIVKGLRVAADFEYELQMAQMNKAISGIQTLFIPCGSSNSFINSTLVREIAKYGGCDRVTKFVPTSVLARLKEKFGS